MTPSDYLDFDDVLSHHAEHLELGEFELIEITGVEQLAHSEAVYDLVVKGNRNYQVKNLGIVHNGGKRAGAGTVALPIWHNDIQDFLDLQTEHGDVRAKAYDVFPQVTIPDIFMRRDQERGSWTTFCPFEVKQRLGIDIRGMHGQDFEDAYLKIEAAAERGDLSICRKYENARDITKLIMRCQFETGLPYLAFTDTINRYNPNQADGYIPNVNLCTESFSNVVADKYGHVCNLASIVLGNIKGMKELGRIAELTTKILDYGINLTNAPDQITGDHNARYRTIGIGLQGLHDYLAREHMNFRDLDHIREISECVEYHAIHQSIQLAKQFGTFGAYDVSEWKNGNRIAEFKKNASGKWDWDALQSEIDQWGVRNSQLTSPAPNCHSLDDQVMTVNGNTTIAEILRNNGIDVDALNNVPPHWIELKIPVEVPVPGGDTEFVERIWWNGVQETIEIEFEDGVTYSFTPNHRLLVKATPVDVWVECKDITSDMEIVDINMVSIQ